MITIFTPAFNRAYIIHKLYNSLCEQTCKDFEWLIVDDGSIDNTKELIDRYIAENKISIKYIRQENKGKQMAVNTGVKNAKGNLFFIVDSDDYVADDAVETILKDWKSVSDQNDVAGLCYRRFNYNTKKMLGKPFPKDGIKATTIEILYKWKIVEDKAEVFRTDLLRNNPFPEIKNEKFISEAYVWNKIAGRKSSRLYCRNKYIYYCDYLQDGLTRNINKVLEKNPKGGLLYYSSLFKYKSIWLNPIALVKTSLRLFQCFIYLCLYLIRSTKKSSV